MASFYDFSVQRRDGSEQSMRDFEGKVVIVVNTATGCGFTPHYEPLEKLYEEYHDKGLEIVDIPCNQFAGQAPESDEGIHEFCQLKYKTQFDQMKKSEINGENALPIYGFLKEQKGFEGFDDHELKPLLEDMFSKADPDWASKPDIKWNFTKFVVDRSGNVVARFEPTADMKKVEECIASLL